MNLVLSVFERYLCLCLTITAQTDKDCEAWKQGLKFLIDEAVNASYPLLIERWLRREFYAIENSHEK